MAINISHALSSIFRFLLLLLLLLVTSVGFGQTDRLYRPSWGLKFNPLAFLAHTPGVELGLEHTIKSNHTVHFAASYLNDFGIFANKNFEGYKLIGEYRSYNLFNRTYPNGYTALQFHFKKAYSTGKIFVEVAGGNYEQLQEASAINTSLDFLIANGYVIILNQRLSLDLSVIYGIKRLSLASDSPAGAALIDRFNDNFFSLNLEEEGDQWFPVLRLQMKLNFELK